MPVQSSSPGIIVAFICTIYFNAAFGQTYESMFVHRLEQPEFVKQHAISTVYSESFLGDTLEAKGSSYYDRLGRLSCYDVYESSGLPRCTYFYEYDSTQAMQSRMIGFIHQKGIREELFFYPKYANGRLVRDSAAHGHGATSFTYDALGRETQAKTIFFDTSMVRTVTRGYLDSSMKISWIKDRFRKNGAEYLDSYRQFHYDQFGNMIMDEERVENHDSSSNTNNGTVIYLYNDLHQVYKIEQSIFVKEFKYFPDELLAESTEGYGPWAPVHSPPRRLSFRYTFY